ncbi:MAG: lamin tail domain-containing protein [Sedimentisphaerales bacterium]|nr:lamin tail domain-containing protein [Sedimentisphaerales bacterium]
MMVNALYGFPRAIAGALLVLAVMAASAQAEVPVAINEILASNTKGASDPQGQHDDWIELYNFGNSAVDVGGMYLTDDPNEPRKWQIPAGNPASTTIPTQGYLVVWADGDAQDAGLHADFKLSANGDEVALFDTDGVTLIDHLTFDRQNPDISYGRYPDGADDLVVMVFPTPQTSNIYFSVGVVADPKFSQSRGFYEEPFMLELSVETEGATIYYTLDGRNPLDDSGRYLAGTPYTGPIEISGTTCVRAAAIRGDWVPSSVVTASYIFLDQVIHQSALPEGFPNSWGGRPADYAMDQRVVQDPAYRDEIIDDLKSIPSVCLVLSNDDLFGSRGIYANPSASGDAWEREASMEWIDSNTGEQFNVNAGLRIHGGPYSRSGNIKNAFRLIFRAQYGAAHLEYPLFPDTEVAAFNMVVLRSIWNYSWTGHSEPTARADYLRDVFARDTVRDMGHLTPHGRPVNLYLNGLYWGLYIMTERVDDFFVTEHVGGDEDDYDILEAPSGMGASTTMQIVAGGQSAVQGWNTLFALSDADVAGGEGYQAIQEYVDIPAMIDYMLMIYYTGSRDAPVFLGDSYTPRNFYAFRQRDPMSPFVFLPWDVEWALEDPYVNRVNVVGVWNPHYLMSRLSANADFRVSLADRIYRHFFNDGVLTREQTTKRYTDRAAEIYGAIVGESARWGDEPRPSLPYTRRDWEAEVNRLVTQYFSGRTQTVLSQLRNRGWYPSFDPPDFSVDNQLQHGGHTPTGATLSLNAGVGTVWYTLDGSDPRVWGTATKPGAQHALVTENAPKRVLVPTGPVDDAWRGGPPFDDSGWTSGAGGVGYEASTGYEQFFSIDVRNQMYGRNATCYVRIPFQVSPDDLPDLSYLALRARYDDGFIAYINGAEVARVAFNGTPAWNSSASVNHSDIDAIAFETFNLTNAIDQLRPGQNMLALQALNESTSSSDLLLSVELLAAEGPAAGAPTGVSPMAIQYSGPIALTGSTHIRARVLNGSTWSAVNEATFAVGPVAESLRISEIMYHPIELGRPDDPNAEYIELTNVGAETINLALVAFTNGVEFTFPDLDLAPGEYVVVVRDVEAFQARYGTDVTIAGQYERNLSNAGERIELRDAADQVIHDFRFEDDWYDLTDGLGFSLVVTDPATADPSAYGEKSTWVPSAEAGGSPGTANPIGPNP